MFIKLWNSKEGKILKGTIISVLIFILTFANALCLVPYLLESHALNTEIQDQDENTDNENVNFKAVFKEIDEQENENEEYSITKNTDEIVMLYATVKSLNGYLKDVNINFQNSNFVCEATEEQNVTLRNIYENETPTFLIPVKVKKSSEFQISQLNMTSNITFTATYVSGETEEAVTSIKQVNVNWEQNEEIAAEVSQSLITNKVYEIDGQQKRVLQVELESKLINSSYPIKTNNIKIDAPQIVGANIQEVKVIAQNNLATNGKELSEENWSYNQETNIIDINIENSISENGKISWLEGTDKFIITYVYNNNEKAVDIASKATNTITLQNDVELEPVEQTLSLEGETSEVGNTISLTTTVNNEIYKGYMYIGEETEFEILNTATITYLNAEESIKIVNSKGTLEGAGTEENFTKSLFSRDQLKNVLGENGTITVYNSEEMETPLKTIELSEELEEIITLEYEEGVSSLAILTSKPVKEGKIEILNYKTVKLLEELTKENIENLDSININSILATSQISIERTDAVSLLEPSTKIEVATETNTLSAIQEENLRISAILKTSSPDCKLFKNPEIQVELPLELETAKIDNISLLYGEELSISKSEIINGENGNKILKVALTGEQTSYKLSEATIVADLEVDANKLTPNKNVELKTTCINNGENVIEVANLKIANQTGLLDKSIITVGEQNSTTINEDVISLELEDNQTATIEKTFVNNYLFGIENMSIQSILPTDTEGNTTIKLTSAVTTNIVGATVLYSVDNINWVSEAENYETIKAFKIEIPDTVAQGNTFKTTISVTGEGETDLNVTGLINGRSILKTYKTELIKKEQVNNEEINNVEIDNLEINNEVEESNTEVEKEKIEIVQTSKTKEQIKENDYIDYIITVKNNSISSVSINLEDKLPKDMVVVETTFLLNDEIIETSIINKHNILKEGINLKPNDVLTLRIRGAACLTYEDMIEIENTARVYFADGTYKESNTVKNEITSRIVIIEENGKNAKDVENQNNNNNIEKENNLYSISGLAWLDDNENGIRDNNEKVLIGIKTMLLNENNEIIKDSNGEAITTNTSINGTYKFNNLEAGQYIVMFEYDNSKYEVTKYQVKETTEDLNSDAISKEITSGEVINKVAITDKLSISDESLINVDIGLLKSGVFDLSLNKYISKLVVTNSAGTTTYTYKNTDFAKTEVRAKYIDETSIVAEYTINITNEGNINGYVTDVIDYISKEFTFNSELNPDWYLGTDGYLHNITLTEEAIEPGTTKKVKIILTKALDSENLSTISNVAEIGGSINIKEIEELDSIPANLKDSEDDIGTAKLLISISTGSPTMYIGIVLGCMLLLRSKYLLH